ncbi:hypothetical protein CCMA1212_007420 [Trichoderma ghanense]|uniref:SSCRP protein n=1 Tax=Trichoderma ghanense TaxID=65468 RepID=A0ABY2GZA6_9HYPO
MAAYPRIVAVFLFFFQVSICRARHLGIPLPTLAAQLPLRNETEFDKRADMQTEMSTCGYQNGDPNKFRTANPGFDCRVDTMNGLWGFCPVTVIAATDCGLAGSCVDHGSCSSGCGKTDNTKLTTFTCGPKQFCSTALLTFGVDQTYSYIGCGGSPKTDHYVISPTASPTPTSRSSETTTTTSAFLSSSKSTDASSGTTPEPTTRSTNAPPTNETNGGSGSTSNGGSPANNTGAIIGGVIGGIALLCISGLVAILLLRRNRPHGGQTIPKGAQRDTHQSWYDASPKPNWKHRLTGGWGPRELEGSQNGRSPDHAIELPS